MSLQLLLLLLVFVVCARFKSIIYELSIGKGQFEWPTHRNVNGWKREVREVRNGQNEERNSGKIKGFKGKLVLYFLCCANVGNPNCEPFSTRSKRKLLTYTQCALKRETDRLVLRKKRAKVKNRKQKCEKTRKEITKNNLQ